MTVWFSLFHVPVLDEEIIEAFSSVFRYTDVLLNIDKTIFDSMVSHYPSELQLIMANVSENEVSDFIYLFYIGWDC